MTWYFDPSGDTFDLYDHNGDLVAENVPQDGWGDSFPRDEVFAEMDAIAVEEYEANGWTDYCVQTVRHATFELIEEGTP